MSTVYNRYYTFFAPTGKTNQSFSLSTFPGMGTCSAPPCAPVPSRRTRSMCAAPSLMHSTYSSQSLNFAGTSVR